MPKTIAGGKYKLGSIIAAGSFGKVYEDPPFAIKEMRVPYRPSQSRQITAIIANQIRIMTQLNHEHTVKLFQVVEEGQYIYMVMELCDGDLRRFTENGALGENIALDYLCQLLEGYSELRRLGIVHRDLKPANILLKDGDLKLADFGMSKLQEGGQLLRSHVGTPYYMAPQVLQRIEYTDKCDIWSLGVIFYQLIFGCLPWTGKNQDNLLSAIMGQPLRFPRQVSAGVAEILEGMLSISEARRFTFEEVQKMLTFEAKTTGMVEEKSYHWSTVRQLVLVEADWQAKMKFKTGYEELPVEKRAEVREELQCLFREEDAYMLSFLT